MTGVIRADEVRVRSLRRQNNRVKGAASARKVTMKNREKTVNKDANNRNTTSSKEEHSHLIKRENRKARRYLISCASAMGHGPPLVRWPGLFHLPCQSVASIHSPSPILHPPSSPCPLPSTPPGCVSVDVGRLRVGVLLRVSSKAEPASMGHPLGHPGASHPTF